MADLPGDGFDRARFGAQLATRRLGRALVVRASTPSTNDDAFDALCAGQGDGVVVVADAQTRGRGRAGRTWEHAPGRALALSVALHLGCDVRQAGLIPLSAGVAAATAIARCGVEHARLKWPNDVLAHGRKLAGVLCEMRRAPAGGDVVVIGVGVNVRTQAEEFPEDLRTRASSIAIERGDDVVRPEDVAARLLEAFEPLWDELQEGERARIRDAWSARAAFWGETVTVRAPGGDVTGVAQRLDDDGGLVLRLESGIERVMIAGDLEPSGSPADGPACATEGGRA